LRRARPNNHSGIHPGRISWNLPHQCIAEDVLRDTDTDGAAQAVEEDGDGVADGYVFLRQHDLYCNEWDLHAHTRTGAREDLVADPHPHGRVRLQRVDHASADREECAAGPRERDVEADDSHEATDGDTRDCDADEVGHGADTTTFGGGALYGLEVEGEIVDVGVEGHGKEGGKETAGEHRALTGDDASGRVARSPRRI